MIQEIKEKGFEPDNYVANVRNYRSLIKKLYDEAKADDGHIERLADAAATRNVAFASLMTEDWCGDSAINVPVLAKLFENAEIPFYIVRGSEHTELNDYYNNSGATHIPVVSIWAEDGTELARWVEAPEAVAKLKDDWKAARPEFMELYEKQKTGDAEAQKQFGTLYREFLEQMAQWYRDEGKWAETTREVVELLEKA